MLKILIVEDEAIIRKSLVHTIDWLSLGCTVAGEADNGARGLAAILDIRPDIVLTDIKMPVMDGMEMLREAAQSVTFVSIILTGFGEFEYARQAIALGVSDYILKPVDEEQLAAAVRKAAGTVQRRVPPLQPVDMAAMAARLRHNSPVRLALTRIQERYKDKLSVEGIAAELKVSPSYLHRKIKEETGLTFLHLLHRYRVQKAVALMTGSDLRLYEISDAVGFSDYKHFCSVFRKLAGSAPTEFIRAISR